MPRARHDVPQVLKRLNLLRAHANLTAARDALARLHVRGDGVALARGTEKAVELLTTLHSLRMQFASSGSSGGADGAGGGGPSSSALANYKETPEEAAQLEAVGATFDMYDTDGGGELDSKELNELMRSLGKGMDDSEAESMLQDLDGDGDGVSFG